MKFNGKCPVNEAERKLYDVEGIMEKMSTAEMLNVINDQEKCIAELRKKIETLTTLNRPSELYVGNNATPMTVAEMVTRELKDCEMLEDVIYYIKSYIEREYGKRCTVEGRK